MLALMILLVAQVGNNEILDVAKQHIDPILKSPASAQYQVTSLQQNEERQMVVAKGTVDAQNSFGGLLRATWKVIGRAGDARFQVDYVEFIDHSGDSTILYTSPHFDRLALELENQTHREIFKLFAAYVGDLEKRTKGLPYNNPKLKTLYWLPINRKLREIQQDYDLTAKEVRDLCTRGCEEKWETINPEDIAAVEKMLSRLK